MAQKKSTAEILAALRNETAAKQEDAGGETPPQPAEPTATAEQPESSPTAPEAKAESVPAAKPEAAGKPRSTKDILAALRAETAGGKPAAAPAKKAIAKKPADKAPDAKAPAAQPAGEKPSVQEMLKAARERRPVEIQAEAEPATPSRQRKSPAAARKTREQAEAPQPTRRSFLERIVLTPFATAWSTFTAASVVFLLGCARFLMPNVLVEPPSRFKIGRPTDYPPDAVSTKWKAEYGVWVVNTVYNGQRQIYALVSVCTHLGCTPNWLEGEQKFKCPCHGSGFYINGVNFEGPAPRPLERAGIAVAPDGMLEVDKSLKFQEEMGQWTDAASYVPVV